MSTLLSNLLGFRSASELLARIDARAADTTISPYHAMCYRLVPTLVDQMMGSAICGDLRSRTYTGLAADFQSSGVMPSIDYTLRTIRAIALTQPSLPSTHCPLIERERLALLALVLVALNLTV